MNNPNNSPANVILFKDHGDFLSTVLLLDGTPIINDGRMYSIDETQRRTFRNESECRQFAMGLGMKYCID